MQGWVSIYRELLDKPIWTTGTPEQKTILITLLLMANHEPNEWEWKGEKFKVERGQFITSLEQITQKCGKGVTIQNVRTSLKRFEKYEFLTNESTNKNRLITIVNYGVYQVSKDETNKQLTSNQQATNKQLTTNNNVNNDNHENNDKKEILLSAFEKFWDAYPRKVDKKKAFEVFKTATKKRELQIIIQGAVDYAKECQVKGTEKRYIKHPTSFLNAESFLNEFDTKQTGGRVNSVGKDKHADAKAWAEENNIPF